MTNARLSTVAALLFAVSMFGAGIGCGESSSGTAGMGGAGGAGGSGGTAGSEAPVITKVQWDWALPCEDTTSAVTVAVSATDDDTEQLSLTYSGSVSDCTPEPFGGNVTYEPILDCDPDSLNYTGTVTVMDPDGNSDTVEFGFFHCESDEVCEDGNPCE